ncbi:polysaccharide biosynthesis protein [Sphingomicrobium sediminis]|uniref:Polysaccharide biosynthesis protein n=1 Tax=Sphingomicrobium sediminis TaxID=2950949 RepID=A0A9X2J0V3_9SPHN|nr:nucleoside-diphosphate sugar epimerase/dehydratase [Sphingomicrobium sediminis]MCM8556643.1 polysaccharide biosynthesis protein [Sphingomicrobium sediminis]
MLSLAPGVRVLIVMTSDIAILALSCYLAFVIRLGEFSVKVPALLMLFALAMVLWAIALVKFRTYEMILRYFGGQGTLRLLLACATMMIGLVLLLGFFQPPDVPRTTAVLQPLLFFFGLVGSRVVAAFLLLRALPTQVATLTTKRLAIFGVGRRARALADSIRSEAGQVLVCFVDPEGEHQGRSIDGVPVLSQAELDELVREWSIDELYLAISKSVRSRTRALYDRVHAINPELPIRLLPSIDQLTTGKVAVSDLRTIKVDDLLGRDPVDPLPHLLDQARAATVMVTGAGGSIGSELCRQLIEQRPKRIILAEMSEYNLYMIERELAGWVAANDADVEIMPRLVDLSDKDSCDRLFRTTSPDIVYHAAAYKHVPLFEENLVEGVRNNVISTLNVAMGCEAAGTALMVLVSTDKAVRPTNAMGASKRMCELVVQARAAVQSDTRYTAVRFGNVLGSSGSVVPLFREQIKHGGPVTLTHRDVTRYFMMIPEAAQLVLQAAAMSEGGETFLLDMGEPVKIADLARRMVALSGRTLKDENNPTGEIEIVETGLRPGEKLYEELLIEPGAETTEHPRIVRAQEDYLPWAELKNEIDLMKRAILIGDEEALRFMLVKLVAGFGGEETVEIEHEATSDEEPETKVA